MGRIDRHGPETAPQLPGFITTDPRSPSPGPEAGIGTHRRVFNPRVFSEQELTKGQQSTNLTSPPLGSRQAGDSRAPRLSTLTPGPPRSAALCLTGRRRERVGPADSITTFSVPFSVCGRPPKRAGSRGVAGGGRSGYPLDCCCTCSGGTDRFSCLFDCRPPGRWQVRFPDRLLCRLVLG